MAPQNLENALKTDPIVSQSMVYGDKRKYLTALVTRERGDRAKGARREKGVTAPPTTPSSSQRPEIRAAVQAAIDGLNAHAAVVPDAEEVRILTDHDFTQETGELTPTLKVKRKVATQKYKAQLDAMYDGEVVD